MLFELQYSNAFIVGSLFIKFVEWKYIYCHYTLIFIIISLSEFVYCTSTYRMSVCTRIIVYIIYFISK